MFSSANFRFLRQFHTEKIHLDVPPVKPTDRAIVCRWFVLMKMKLRVKKILNAESHFLDDLIKTRRRSSMRETGRHVTPSGHFKDFHLIDRIAQQLHFLSVAKCQLANMYCASTLLNIIQSGSRWVGPIKWTPSVISQYTKTSLKCFFKKVQLAEIRTIYLQD